MRAVDPPVSRPLTTDLEQMLTTACRSARKRVEARGVGQRHGLRALRPDRGRARGSRNSFPSGGRKQRKQRQGFTRRHSPRPTGACAAATTALIGSGAAAISMAAATVVAAPGRGGDAVGGAVPVRKRRVATMGTGGEQLGEAWAAGSRGLRLRPPASGLWLTRWAGRLEPARRVPRHSRLCTARSGVSPAPSSRAGVPPASPWVLHTGRRGVRHSCGEGRRRSVRCGFPPPPRADRRWPPPRPVDGARGAGWGGGCGHSPWSQPEAFLSLGGAPTAAREGQRRAPAPRAEIEPGPRPPLGGVQGHGARAGAAWPLCGRRGRGGGGRRVNAAGVPAAPSTGRPARSSPG